MTTKFDRLRWPAAIVLCVAGLLVVSRFWQFTMLATALLIDGATVIGYFAAAAGFGAWIGRAMWGKDHRQPMGATAMGCAAMLGTAWLCAWAGVLNVVTAWAMLVAGWAALLLVVKTLTQVRISAIRMSWAVVLVAPVVGLMIGAAMIAPGILWQPMEAGGYDVLSYHLQLPAEWLRNGAMTGLHHNVYSYLPNLVEAGFMQLAAIKGGAANAALCCQLLSAGFALLAAGAIGAAVLRSLPEQQPHRSLFAATAGAMSLALPWTVVTGSMAYDEQAVQFFMAAALTLLVGPMDRRHIFSAGLLAGFACLAKLTSVGLVALPLFAVVLIASDRRWRSALWFIVGAAIPVVFYMARNALWTGNPLFPMATGVFGTAHWTAEQAARWQAAHQPHLPVIERVARVWDMVLAQPQFAYILWSTAGVAVVGMIADSLLRRVGVMLAVMIGVAGLFWMCMTHEQSRFALPLIVPACIAIGAGLSLVRTKWIRIALVIGLVVWPGAMSWQLWFAQNPEASLLIDGVDAMRTQVLPYAPFNGQLAGGRVYAEGWATPLYMDQKVTYHTVWDRSELGALIDQHGVRGAMTALARQGYAYLLIDRAMIHLWMSPGNYGYDPSITPERLAKIENIGLPEIYDGDQLVIYQLPKEN